MATTRPMNLNLLSIKFPVMAISSILHRMSGVYIFLSLPCLLWTLQHSLSSKAGFDLVVKSLQNPLTKLYWLSIITAVIYHVLAGLRHITMDFGFLETKQAGRITAWGVIILSFAGFVITGICLW